MAGDETSSSGSSSSDSSSDSEPEQRPSKDVAPKSDTETSSSGSSSSNSSDSEPEPAKTVQKRKWAVYNVKPKTPALEAPAAITTLVSATTPPGKGKNTTRNRNKRRRESKRLNIIKSKGILPVTATKADLHKFEEETSRPERQEMVAAGGDRAAFEAKRQDLLTSIATGGIDVGLGSSLQSKDAEMIQDQFSGDEPLSKATFTQDTIMTDKLASAEGSGKFEGENPSANDPISTSITTGDQDLAADSPTKAKDTPPPGSTSTTTTALMPDSITTIPAEAMEILMDEASSTPAAVEAPGSRTAPAPDSQHRRSKLDMSGAKRMLFGALGLRTPKSRDDELKTREKLMKDVRPIKEPHVNESIETIEDVAAAAEDESWKDKIDLRAVECCYEGIELSTPPFPFVQRWDPQQQRGYNMGNARKRKGKKRKRNNDDYNETSSFRPQDQAARRNNQKLYEDSSYNPQNKAARLNEDDWPRQEAEREASAEETQAESKDQDRSHDENLEDSIKINQQLLHETEDASADTLVEMEETDNLASDLPTLPEDLSRFSSLTLDTAAKGNIVAFKQLEMSADTNWQPKISGYRTAVVDTTLDDGTLSMTLAKRDQPSKEVRYDEQTGERLYSKFEMPGYHDENGEDNNGKIEISFDELIDPVLVEAAGQNGNQDDLLQAQDHTVAHVDSNDRGISNEAHDTDAGPQGVSLEGQISNEEAAEPSEEARQEISKLIRDAGWRSSVNQELIDRQDDGSPNQREDLDQPALVDPPSPKFHGFNSSPLTNGFQVASSPPPAALQTPRHVHAPGFEIAESVPPQGPDDSPAHSIISNHRSAIDYPDIPQIGDESDVFQQEAQDRSGLLEAEHQIASQDLTLPSSIRQSPSQSLASPNLTPSEKSSLKMVNVYDGADSDDSLPELFSQAFEKRISQGREIKAEASEEDPVSPPSHRKSKRNSRIDSSQRESNRSWGPDYYERGTEDEGASTPRPSQTVFSSQIVDLTISSDTMDPPDDSYNDDDSYVLPTGPGWVQKPRTSMSHDGPSKKTTRRGSTRSR